MKLNKNIAWTVDGKIMNKTKFNEAMEKITTVTFNEEGSLNHEWYVAEDQETIHIYERYQDSDAALAHLNVWSKFAALFLEGATMDTFNVYGNVTPELKSALAGATNIMSRYGGFVK
ncbi:antibiotic biosynthesis monooxygenase [Cellulophaga baltica 4]|nr:antibiotic biosynthesis monooxygenase [Cellulophaga baltica 4]